MQVDDKTLDNMVFACQILSDKATTSQAAVAGVSEMDVMQYSTSKFKHSWPCERKCLPAYHSSHHVSICFPSAKAMTGFVARLFLQDVGGEFSTQRSTHRLHLLKQPIQLAWAFSSS